MNAEEARKLTREKEERQKEIKKLIERGEKGIKASCENGQRYHYLFAGYVCDGMPDYQEVVEHFQKLGYKTKYEYGTNVFKVTW